MICDDPEYMPRRATKGSAGYDFYAQQDYTLTPGLWTDIDLGVRFDGTERIYHDLGPDHYLTDNFVLLLFPRSGLSTKYGFRLANTIAVIDRDYRNNMRAMVTTDKPLDISKGDRIVQGIFIMPHVLAGEIEPTAERKGGFGSTGQ